ILGDIPAGAIRENTFSRYPVGSGPFVFRLLQTNGNQDDEHKIVQMTAFDKYFLGEPSVNRLEIHAHPSSEKAVASLKSGATNAVSGVPVSTAEGLGAAGYSVTRHRVSSGVYALFNVSKPALKDKAVRK